jgi:hypothetical protein
MWADIMTKPLQGTVFRVMRAELMNCDINYEDSWRKRNQIQLLPPRRCHGRMSSRQPSRHRRSVLGRTGIWGRFDEETLYRYQKETDGCQKETWERHDSELRCGKLECQESEEEGSRK